MPATQYNQTSESPFPSVLGATADVMTIEAGLVGPIHFVSAFVMGTVIEDNWAEESGLKFVFVEVVGKDDSVEEPMYYKNLNTVLKGIYKVSLF